MSFKADWITKSAPITMETKHECLNFDKIIKKQQLIIESLAKEIQLLRKILNLSQQTHNQKFFEFSPIPDPNAVNLDGIFKQISELLGVAPLKTQNGKTLLDAVKKLKQTANQKQQPIFIERIKEVKVPFHIEHIVVVNKTESTDPNDMNPLGRSESKKELNACLNKDHSFKQDAREREVKNQNKQYNSRNETAKNFQKRQGDNQGKQYRQKKYD